MPGRERPRNRHNDLSNQSDDAGIQGGGGDTPRTGAGHAEQSSDADASGLISERVEAQPKHLNDAEAGWMLAEDETPNPT
jgi:hypothetical protein